MLILIILGVAILIAGVLLVFFPDSLKRHNDDFKQVVNKVAVSLDEKVLRLRSGIGISCILISLTCFFLAYWIMKKHG